MEVVNNWGGLNPQDDKKFEELTEKYMPASGKADTLGGEIIRAINRIVYRFYNDGDTVDRYYGSPYNHSKSCNWFLVDNVPGFKSLEDINEDYFGVVVNKALKFVLDYLLEHEEVFNTPNDEDCLDNAPYELWEENEDLEVDDWEEDDWY